jgi:asparagine synthase (glutamine-hydrolysing)
MIEPLVRQLPDSFGYKDFIHKLRWLVAMSQSSAGERYAQSAVFLRFSHAHKQALYTEALWRTVGNLISEESLLRFFEADNASEPIDKMLYTDVKTRLADHLLMISDRMTMAYGLESRSPFADQKVAEFVATIPAELKLRGSRLKYIQRQIAREYLPNTLIKRPKQGFGFPLARWFKYELRDLTVHIFLNSRLASAGYFRQEAISTLLSEHLSGRFDHNYRLWLLLNLELWYRQFIDGFSRNDLTEMLYDRYGNDTGSDHARSIIGRFSRAHL